MAHESLWQQVIELDGPETAQKAGCRYLGDPSRYIITLLNVAYEVNPADKQICSVQIDSPPAPAGFLEQLCILTYLIHAQDLPLSGKLVKPQTLPGGQFFFRAVHAPPNGKLEKAFGQSPRQLYEIAQRLNAKKCEFGDASIELKILPRLPVTIVIWAGCEEFSARASILFDQTAANHLPLDALFAAINLTVKTIIQP